MNDPWVERIKAIGEAVSKWLTAAAALVLAWQGVRYVDEFKENNQRVYQVQLQQKK